MLGIDFAKVPAGLKGIAGMEFMDYQSPDFYNELRAAFAKCVKETQAGNSLVMEEAEVEAVNNIVFKHTGMLIDFHEPNEYEVANAAIDAGWFSPGNIVNIKGIEQWFSAKESNIGKAFKALKVNVIKGWVDTSKGRVGGDFSKIKLDIFVQKYLDTFLSPKSLARNKTTMADALAMIVLHECGHAFTGFLYIVKTYMDSMMTLCAVRLIENNKAYGKERVAIVKETLSVLECDVAVDQDTIDKLDNEGLVVFFNKATINRDYRRTLSLGTADRGSEIFADLFAVRFGAPKVMVAALASLPSLGNYEKIQTVLWTGIAILGYLAFLPFYTGLGILMAGLHIVSGIDTMINPSNTYDSPYRRIKALLRDQIVRLNEDKRIPARDKVQMLKDAKEMEKMVDEQKPFLEGTAAQRLTGWMYSGSDFKLQQFEHYNEELTAHTLSLYKEAF